MTNTAERLAIAVEHHQAGRLPAAEEIYRSVVTMDPSQANAWHLLGVLNVQLGRHDAGIECIRRALALQPGWAEAHFNLGWALTEQKKSEEAASCFRRAIELKPDYVEAHDTLGVILAEQGQLEQAAACHLRALQLNPDYAVAYNRLGLALAAQGNLDEATARFRRALELVPDFVGARINLGNACVAQGKLEEGLACLRRALELRPDDARVRSAYLLMTQYDSSVTPRQLADDHAAFEREHATPLRATWCPHENIPDPERRLRVGFVSYDLRRHPVGYFVIRLLENLDQERCEAVLYRDGPIRDDLTARFQTAVGKRGQSPFVRSTLRAVPANGDCPLFPAPWSDVYGWSDERLVEQIRLDRIDILFDLGGHTGENRLLVFARKPAPIQITWAGYVGTTGLAAMDYILADRFEIPVQSEEYYRERVLRMPDDYICYDPPDYAPSVSPLPAIEKGYVTFAAFHNPAKITAKVIEVWAQILKRLPKARLVLKYRGMDDASVAGRRTDSFTAQGIERGRLEFLAFSPHREALAEYGRVDVALDTFPYNGGLTTCEAMWMGVPVVTFPGETFAGRHSLSHLSNVGLTETIAGDLREYVENAVALASDLPRLVALRAGLRERMAASPLCDGKRFAKNFAEILRSAWRDWCEKQAEPGRVGPVVE